MIDSKKVLYLPTWVKLSSTIILLICLAASVTVSLKFVGIPDHSDWILISMSMAQLAATALIFSLIIIFGERDANINVLQSKTEIFLEKQAPAILSKIEDSLGENPKVTASKPNNIFGANYTLSTSTTTAKIWLGVNIDRIIVIYFLKGIKKADAMQTFSYTFGGAESVGYKVNFEEAIIGDTSEEILSIWCTWPKIQNSDNLATELLNHPEKKLFILQDIAMMTQSFLRTAQRNKINICTITDPGPL
jgi:hypothetical protein